MDKIFFILILYFFSFGLFAQDKDTKISEITVDELTEVVRTIVQETLENCSVTGEMNGRAKINLEVEGEVIARIVCEFEAKDEVKE
tara:strand:- start:26433 stop:26690 length:258 start_codon:yes stop_codon:yes gene_type:complete